MNVAVMASGETGPHSVLSFPEHAVPCLEPLSPPIPSALASPPVSAHATDAGKPPRSPLEKTRGPIIG